MFSQERFVFSLIVNKMIMSNMVGIILFKKLRSDLIFLLSNLSSLKSRWSQSFTIKPFHISFIVLQNSIKSSRFDIFPVFARSSLFTRDKIDSLQVPLSRRALQRQEHQSTQPHRHRNRQNILSYSHIFLTHKNKYLSKSKQELFVFNSIIRIVIAI